MYLILLLLDLERKEEEVERVTSIVAIEEPEAHLHPHLQRQVFRDLLKRADAVSVILSTHSPYITSVSGLKSIILLKRTVAGTIGRTIHGAGISYQELLDLQRYIDVTRAEFLFSKKVILVEGIAEEFILPVLANQLAKRENLRSLDSQGVSIVNIAGTHFITYAKLLGKQGFDIPAIIITDGDPGLKDNGEIFLAGLERGSNIIEQTDYNNLSTIDMRTNETWRQSLSKHNIFVGYQTLEIDLVSAGCREPIIETFKQLGAGARIITELEELMATWEVTNLEKRERLIKLIERFGKKGRFAQRLAEYINIDCLPDYIRDALVMAMT